MRMRMRMRMKNWGCEGELTVKVFDSMLVTGLTGEKTETRLFAMRANESRRFGFCSYTVTYARNKVPAMGGIWLERQHATYE